MYISANTAEKIKLIAKSKKISISEMLLKCELSKNALSSMLSRGSWLQANNLAKIADYLDCSVDYLLGRTETPSIQSDNDFPVLEKYSFLNQEGKKRIDEYIEDLIANPKYTENTNIKLVADSELSTPPKNLKSIKHT